MISTYFNRSNLSDAVNNFSLINNYPLSSSRIEILEDPKLFWDVFCKAHSQKDPIPASRFSVIEIRGQLKIFADQETTLKVKKFIEEMRNVLLTAHIEHRNVTLLPISIAHYIFVKELQEEPIDLVGELPDSGLPDIGGSRIREYDYKTLILPAMPHFCQLIGATCSNVRVEAVINTGKGNTAFKQSVKGFEINWGSNYVFYPIPPMEVSPPEDFAHALYEFYQKGIDCDFSLKTSDDSLKINLSVLLMSGGPVLQAMIRNKMKEAQDMEVNLSLYSSKTVVAFVDFLYLGKEGLKPQSFSREDIDVFTELLEMARYYELVSLTNCCTNLITLFATSDDIEGIADLANAYENEHLHKLYEYLVLKNDPEVIKV